MPILFYETVTWPSDVSGGGGSGGALAGRQIDSGAFSHITEKKDIDSECISKNSNPN